MQYTFLGKTGMKVSRLCLGTMNFGARATEEDGRAIMDKALELGINFFDTARGYTDSEEKLGRILSQHRPRVMIATKSFARSRDLLLKDIEASLKKIPKLLFFGDDDPLSKRKGPLIEICKAFLN